MTETCYIILELKKPNVSNYIHQQSKLLKFSFKYKLNLKLNLNNLALLKQNFSSKSVPEIYEIWESGLINTLLELITVKNLKHEILLHIRYDRFKISSALIFTQTRPHIIILSKQMSQELSTKFSPFHKTYLKIFRNTIARKNNSRSWKCLDAYFNVKLR